MDQVITALYFKIIACKQEHQRDLKRIYTNCRRIQTEISKEDVICRRFGKDSPKMLDLREELVQAVNNLEQYLVFATLLNG